MSEENNEYSFENEQYRRTYWHTCSHVLAQAVKRLHPEVKLRDRSFDRQRLLLRLRRAVCLHARGSWKSWRPRCARSARKSSSSSASSCRATEAIKYMEEKNEPYKVELINDLPVDAAHFVLHPGRVHRPLRRPASGLHRTHQGQRHQADGLQRGLLARRLQPSDAAENLRRCVPEEGGAGRVSGAASKRRRSATTASSARSLACSC